MSSAAAFMILFVRKKETKKECAIQGKMIFFCSFKYIKFYFLHVLYEIRRHPQNTLLVRVYFNLTDLIYCISDQKATEHYSVYQTGQLL